MSDTTTIPEVSGGPGVGTTEWFVVKFASLMAVAVLIWNKAAETLGWSIHFGFTDEQILTFIQWIAGGYIGGRSILKAFASFGKK